MDLTIRNGEDLVVLGPSGAGGRVHAPDIRALRADDGVGERDVLSDREGLAQGAAGPPRPRDALHGPPDRPRGGVPAGAQRRDAAAVRARARAGGGRGGPAPPRPPPRPPRTPPDRAP